MFIVCYIITTTFPLKYGFKTIVYVSLGASLRPLLDQSRLWYEKDVQCAIIITDSKKKRFKLYAESRYEPFTRLGYRFRLSPHPCNPCSLSRVSAITRGAYEYCFCSGKKVHVIRDNGGAQPCLRH